MRIVAPALLAALAALAPIAAIAQGALPTARYLPPPPTPLDAEIGQRLTGTLSIDANEIRVGGELRGCNVVYVAAARDFTYRQGGAVVVSGSVQLWWSPPHQLLWAIKVVPQDVVAERDGSLGRRTFTPSLAWMQSPRFSTVGRMPQPFMCEGGGFCGAGSEGLAEFLEAVLIGSFRLGIQRWPGAMDFIMQLDLGTAPNGRGSADDFGRCMSELIERASRD
jgi:hypothetical protein